MHAFLIVLRCNNSDIPVSFFKDLNEALGSAQQLVQDVRQNYSIVYSYARLVNAPNNTSPLCVSIYQFISNELRPVLGSYYIDRELPTDGTAMEHARTIKRPAAACPRIAGRGLDSLDFPKRRVWSVKPGLITEGGLHLTGTTSIARPASATGGLTLGGNSTRVGGNSQTFFSNTTFTMPGYFTPGGQITLIAIGGGASGDGGGPTAAGGGGAGAYARTVINVGPGQPITVNVGAAGLGANGGDSWASITGSPPANPGQGAPAKGGAPGIGTAGGNGGSAAASIGTTKQAGGNGGNVPGGGPYGGGGGGGAGLANHQNGTDGAINTPGTGAAGDFGSGGNGGNPLGNPNGQNATGTGSGCGGGGGTTGYPRGLGSGGRVIIQW